jgi:signal transduction histidine kinase
MALLSSIGEILSTREGSLVYYLLVLWAVLACLGMAWGEWQRTRNERVQRLLIAMGGMVLVRAVYAVGALIASVGWVEGVFVLPPLERFVDTASISFLAWGFMPSPRHRVRTWDWLLGVNVVLAAAVCLVFTRLWGQALAGGDISDYNGYWQSAVWLVWQLGLVLLASYGAVRSQGAGWGTFVSAMLILFVGGLAQWLFPPKIANVPVWQRVANLVAYPLIAIAVYQEIFAGLRVRSRELQDISQASLDQIKSLLNLFEAGQHTSGSLDLSTVLDNAVRGIARVLDADQCAIVFPEEGDSGTMRLVAIYNPTRQGRGEAVTFPLDYQLAVQQAIRRKKPVVVEQSENIQLKVLFALLGSGETGPLLVQPLLTKTDAVGAIIAGNARSRRPFTPNEVKLCQSMAGQLGAAIQNARRFQAAQDQIQTLSRSQTEERRLLQQAKVRIQQLTDQLAEARVESQELKSSEETIREERDALEIQLARVQAEADTLSARLVALETDLAQAHAHAEAQLRWQEEELSRLQAEWAEGAGTEESTQAVLQGLTVGVLVTDAHGVIQQTNMAAEALLDAHVDELKGLELAEISNDEQWLRAVATAGDGQAVRLTMQGAGNTLMCDLAPLPPPVGRPEEGQRLVVVFQDITAAMEEQRQRLNIVQDLDAVRVQERLALAEELRTPTTTIINYADLLLGEAVGGLGSAQHKFLTRIKSVAERMAQMANDLVREVSPDQEPVKPQRQRVDVSRFIEATVAESYCQWEDGSITLELDLPDDLPAVKTDPDYLRRVLSNLLSNACLASAEGGQVRVQAAGAPAVVEQEAAPLNGDGFVMVSVIDSGGGLSDEALQQVFDQSRPSRTPPGLGESGAGLALARTLVEAQGGRLWVESENGVGTTFRFILPVNDVG